MNTMEITDGRWRALARSSPWRWRSVHLTWHHALDDEDAVAWLRDRTDLRVEHAGRVDVAHHEQPAMMPPRPLPRAHEIAPVLDADGLVTVRPDRMAADLEDPFWQTYLWIALLDPVELADGDWSRDPATGHEVRGDPPVLLPDPYERLGWPTLGPVPGTVLADLRETERRGRRTWWAQVTPTWAYDPRCSCCPLLPGEVTEWLESSGGGTVSPLTDHPEGHEVALDVETGICVAARPIGPASPFAGHDVTIHEVDGTYPDEMFEAAPLPV